MQVESNESARFWRRVRQAAIAIGILLIIPAVLIIAAQMLGFVSSDLFAIGSTSGIRVLASIAVFGCLMAAIGYWDQ